MKAVILAGGKGKRMGPLSKEIPKPLIKIGDKPILEHQIVLLRKYGIRDIWLLLGYLGNQIREYFGDGRKWQVNISYHQEEKLLGTAGAIKVLEQKIKKDFLVFSGDIMLDFDVQRFINYHQQKTEKVCSLIVHPTDHPFDSDLVELDNSGRITSLLIRPHRPGTTFRNLSIASVFIFSPKIFRYIPKKKKSDIEKDILPLILKSKQKIYAYNTPEYLKDVGTPERLRKVRQDYLSDKIKQLKIY